MKILMTIKRALSAAALGLSVVSVSHASPPSQICGVDVNVFDGTYSTLYANSSTSYCGFNLILDPFNSLVLTWTRNHYYTNVPCSGEGSYNHLACDPETGIFKADHQVGDDHWECYLRPEDPIGQRLNYICYVNGRFQSQSTYIRWNDSGAEYEK